MHPAPSLVEAPPNGTDEDRSGQRPTSPGSSRQDHHTPSESPPLRKDTNSSTSTTTSTATDATITSNETAVTSYSASSSPTYANNQAVFSVMSGNDPNRNRGTSRRRHGPLTEQQRHRAALVRKIGACPECRRRRVACDPAHHNLTWEEVMKKHKPRSPPPPLMGIAPLGRPLSPAPAGGGRLSFTHDPQEMDIDTTPTPLPPPGTGSMNEAHRLRTPLPSGRSLEKLASAALPGIDAMKADLHSIATWALTNPNRSRYKAATVLLLYWEDDDDQDVARAVRELASVLQDEYHYTFDIYPIPASSDEGKSPFRALHRRMVEMVDDRDRRDVLKIVYYNGHTHLDADREMCLASSVDRQAARTIKWHTIQSILEDATSDTLIIMDATYYASEKAVQKRAGVMELLASTVGDDHQKALGRTSFTRALTEQLRNRIISQKFRGPLTATELHCRLMSQYTRLVQDPTPELKVVSSFPMPFHWQITAANTRLPPILLAPAPTRRGLPSMVPEPDPTAPHMTVTIRLTDDAINTETWGEWFRAMPDGIKDVKVDGPYRNTFR